jgi:hypothetical protein
MSLADLVPERFLSRQTIAVAIPRSTPPPLGRIIRDGQVGSKVEAEDARQRREFGCPLERLAKALR